MRLSEDQIEDVKARADLASVARDLGARLRKSGTKLLGSCPICGGGKGATRFEIESRDKWVCAVCNDGGDVIRLVQRATGRDFLGAVDYLGGARGMSDEEAARLRARREAERRKREDAAERYRQRTIAAQRRIWALAEYGDIAPVRDYLAARGCDLPATAELRSMGMEFYHGEVLDEFARGVPRKLYEGPAMIAAIRDNAGDFLGLHITWIDLTRAPKCRPQIIDPDTGEDLPTKKVKGSKAAGHIVLRAAERPRRLFLGEGIETGLSVATAFRRARAFESTDAFWTSVDLGNFGGPARETVKHSTLKHNNGHAVRFPGPEPELTQPSIWIPDSVEELFLLGDGDSEFELTDAALERAARRYARPGRVIRKCFAPGGVDFNDVLVGKWPPSAPLAVEGKEGVWAA